MAAKQRKRGHGVRKAAFDCDLVVPYSLEDEFNSILSSAVTVKYSEWLFRNAVGFRLVAGFHTAPWTAMRPQNHS